MSFVVNQLTSVTPRAKLYGSTGIFLLLYQRTGQSQKMFGAAAPPQGVGPAAAYWHLNGGNLTKSV
jgi:hypothetical protein